MKVSLESLAATLKNLGYETKKHPDTNQLYTSYTYQDSEYPLFVRLLSDGFLVQLITFIPCSISDKAANDLNRFLHMVNKELDMPGFCDDEESKTVFYRLVIPCLNQDLSDELFSAYINTARNICQTFGTVIHAVAIGAMPLEEVLQQMNEKQKVSK